MARNILDKKIYYILLRYLMYSIEKPIFDNISAKIKEQIIILFIIDLIIINFNINKIYQNMSLFTKLYSFNKSHKYESTLKLGL